MKWIEQHPMSMILLGILGISLSSIFVKYSDAPAAMTAASRLCWTVALMTPVVLGKQNVRREMKAVPRKELLLSVLSGVFLAIHFVTWFESLNRTSVASSTAIVCTEVIWVCVGDCLFLGGRITKKAGLAIAVTLGGSLCIAFADSASGGQLLGDALALIAAVAVAVYTLIGRSVRKSVSTTVYTYLVYCACAAVLVLTCAVQGVGEIGIRPVVVGLLLAVFSTILGHSIFSWCLKYFSPEFVSASKLCEPVAASALAAVLFAQIPGSMQILGGGLIIGGVLWYSRLETHR